MHLIKNCILYEMHHQPISGGGSLILCHSEQEGKEVVIQLRCDAKEASWVSTILAKDILLDSLQAAAFNRQGEGVLFWYDVNQAGFYQTRLMQKLPAVPVLKKTKRLRDLKGIEANAEEKTEEEPKGRIDKKKDLRQKILNNK